MAFENIVLKKKRAIIIPKIEVKVSEIVLDSSVPREKSPVVVKNNYVETYPVVPTPTEAKPFDLFELQREVEIFKSLTSLPSSVLSEASGGRLVTMAHAIVDDYINAISYLNNIAEAVNRLKGSSVPSIRKSHIASQSESARSDVEHLVRKVKLFIRDFKEKVDSA